MPLLRFSHSILVSWGYDLGRNKNLRTVKEVRGRLFKTYCINDPNINA